VSISKLGVWANAEVANASAINERRMVKEFDNGVKRVTVIKNKG